MSGGSYRTEIRNRGASERWHAARWAVGDTVLREEDRWPGTVVAVDRCPHRYAWQAAARIPVAEATQMLRDVLGDESDFLERARAITRKTLRKVGGG